MPNTEGLKGLPGEETVQPGLSAQSRDTPPATPTPKSPHLHPDTGRSDEAE